MKYQLKWRDMNKLLCLPMIFLLTGCIADYGSPYNRNMGYQNYGNGYPRNQGQNYGRQNYGYPAQNNGYRGQANGYPYQGNGYNAQPNYGNRNYDNDDGRRGEGRGRGGDRD